MKALNNIVASIVGIISLMFLPGDAFGQYTQPEGVVVIDTMHVKSQLNNAEDLKWIKEHSPSKAALYSAVLPGLGQVYNKKYWKLPLVYGAIGTGVYIVVWNQDYFSEFRDAYRIRLSGGKDDYFNRLPKENQLVSQMDFYRNQRDLAVLITIGLYAFNILDAYVDAHLIDFNVSDDLSVRVEPGMINSVVYNNYAYGLKLSMDL